MSVLRARRPVRTAAGLLAALMITGLLAGCGGDASTADPSPAVPDLAGSTWDLGSYADTAGAQTPAVTDAVAPLAFAEDGTLAGSTGCNRFAGTYTQVGAKLRIALGPVTLVGCMGPVADQEQALLDAMPRVTSSQRAGSDLQLTDADGAVLVVYTPGATTVIGSAWQATGINNGTGGVVSADETSAATAQFGPDGTVSGSGGCNTFTAPYTLDGSQGVEIGPVASTKMACPEPVSSTEQQFFAGLEAATTYLIEGDTLILRDAQDATQVTLRAVN